MKTAKVDDFGVVEDRHEDLAGGYTVDFLTVREDVDMAPLLKGLPGDQCQCPHWGYVLKGKVTWQHGDREEVFEAGDAYYLPPGHVPKIVAGSEVVQFSPTDALQATNAAIERNMGTA